MAVSLMNLLGGQTVAATAAGMVAKETNAAENSSQSHEDISGTFEAIISAAGAAFVDQETILQNVAASQKLTVLMPSAKPTLPTQLQSDPVVSPSDLPVQKAVQLSPMQFLPSDVAVGVQEIISDTDKPEETLVDNNQAGENFLQLPTGNAKILDELIAQLPQRELTAEELSEIVQATHIEPLVIFDALRNTPAASPNLATAMVDDMGVATVDAGLPLPKPSSLSRPKDVMDASAEALSTDETPVQPDASAKTRDIPVLTPSQQQVVQKIVDILQGASSQAELPEQWLSRVAALSAAKPESTKMNTEESAEIPPSLPATEEQLVSASVAILKVARNDNTEKAPANIASEQVPVQEEAKTSHRPEILSKKADKPIAETPISDLARPSGQEILSQKPAEHSFADLADPAALNVTVQDASAKPADIKPSIGIETAKFASAQTGTENAIENAEGLVNGQVLVKFKQALSKGESSMEIRLKPVELGSVEVKIETTADGHSRIHVTAEKRDTLDLLQRDARSLERALQDLGFKSDNSSLSFNMRGDQQHQQAGNHAHENDQGKGQFSLNGGYANEEEELPQAYEVSRAYNIAMDRGVDISV